MIRQLRNVNLYLMVGADAVLLILAHLGAYLLRFEFSMAETFWHKILLGLPWIILVKLLLFAYFGLYRGMWRYTSLFTLQRVLFATITSTLVIMALIAMIFHFQGYPRSVFFIDFILTFLFTGGIRVCVRMIMNQEHKIPRDLFQKIPAGECRRLLIIGAGKAGEKVVREIMDNPSICLRPVGFLDDDPYKWGKSIHNVIIRGNVEDLFSLVGDVDEILIAIPSATGAQMRQIVSVCKKVGKPFKTLPPLGELIEGHISMKVAREIKLSDVIGREEVLLDEGNIRKYLTDKRVLVTGAGGSIGSELVRQICRFKPQAIALLDFSEYNLYQVEIDTRTRFEDITVNAYLADLRNLHTTQRVFKEFKPDVVFHAAAYKHVPLQELNPWEALCNNLLGAMHTVECSIKYGVDKFVLVSSDKAVRPTNVMGATKRICELLLNSINGRAKTKFIAVRFGNVIGSSGSVIPLFQQQIAQGGPLTVTHPEITRYFMSIPEAAQLILQAGAMGTGGEIFILKMGDPVRIADLARDFIRLHGLEPDKDIEIVYTGLRPGEKLYEELITEGEGIVPTHHEKIMVLRGKGFNHNVIVKQTEELIEVANTFKVDEIKRKIKEIVPEYCSG